MKATKGSNKWLKREQKKRERRVKKSTPQPPFYRSAAWKRIRYQALKRAHGHCQCCGAGPEHGAVLNVDHIKPLSRFPELGLDLNNLQVLCASCNRGKGGWDRTDWRPKEISPEEIERDLDMRALDDLRERGLLH